LSLQEYLTNNTNIFEAAFRSLKLPEDECKYKLQQSDCIISNLKATIDDLTKTGKANNRTIQEQREKQKQLQANIDDLTKTVQSLNQTVQLLCGRLKDVSTCKVEAVITSKWTEIPLAINIATFLPNNVVS
jgi:uncharacterized protein YigA (DUF484 family)